MIQIDNLYQLTTDDQGSFIRLDGISGRLGLEKPHKKACYKIIRVWLDGGINLRKHGVPNFIRPSFVPAGKMVQRAEVYTADEFDKLPE